MENLAVVLAIAYLFLAIRQNILCWLCAASSSLIYVALFFNVKLYMESILNIFYFCMAVYGWLSWRSSNKNSSLKVISWDLSVHIRSIFVISVISIASGYILNRHTDAAFPYIDSLTTFFSIWATYLVAKKNTRKLVVLVANRHYIDSNLLGTWFVINLAAFFTLCFDDPFRYLFLAF